MTIVIPLDGNDRPLPNIGYDPSTHQVTIPQTTAALTDPNTGAIYAPSTVQEYINGLPIGQNNPVPANQVVGTPVYATATLAAATGGNVSLPGVAGKTTYINGFVVSVAHTSAGVVAGQVLLSLNAGVTTHMNFLIAVSTTYPGLVQVTFPDPIPALAANTAIQVTAPALAAAGIGSIAAFGYQL